MYPPIVPYLLVPDGAAALDFLARAFGAEERMRVPGADGRGVMHAEVTVGTGLVMLAEPPRDEAGAYPPPAGPSPVGIMVQLGAPADVERLHERAVAEGGTSEIAPRDEAWGARFAGIVDPSGHRWWLHAPLAGS
jgi:PhnB protein